MPRKPTYSPSKLTTYLACPHKYYWTYLNPRGRWFVRSRSEFSFGQSLHRVLEMFHGSNDQGVETVEQALAALDENWVEAGFGSAEEMAEAYGEGKAIIERYVDEHRVPKVGAQTIAVEKALRADLGEFVLVGRVDRLDRLDDGTLEVVDYKTQRTAVSPEDVDSSIAMGCYQLLLSKLHPGVRVCDVDGDGAVDRVTVEPDRAAAIDAERYLAAL